MVAQIVLLSKSTQLPDEDLWNVVKKLQSISSDSSETLKYTLTTINNIFHDPAFFVLFYRLLHCRNIHVNLLASMLTCISMICCVIHQFYLVLQLIHLLLVSEDYISYSSFVSEDHISKSKSQLKLLLLLKIIVLPNNQVFCLYRVMPC